MRIIGIFHTLFFIVAYARFQLSSSVMANKLLERYALKYLFAAATSISRTGICLTQYGVTPKAGQTDLIELMNEIKSCMPRQRDTEKRYTSKKYNDKEGKYN